MKFKKHEHGKEKKDCESVLTPGKDVTASHQRIWTNTKRYNVLTAVRQVEEERGQIIGLHHILPLKTNSNLAKIIEDEHDYCIVKVPSEEVVFECSQIEEASKDVNLPSIQPEIHVFNTFAPSADMVRNECESVKGKLFLSQDEAADVEKNTRGQSADSLWHDNRNQRITSSKCYRCAVLKNSISPTKAIQEVLGYKEFPPTKEMKEGLSKEPEIIEEYLITMKETGHKGIEVKKSGLVVSVSHGFLASSPDGLVHDPSHESAEGMLEIKYIQMKEGETLNDALTRKRICVCDNGELKVNRNHQYFYEIQHQMHVAVRSWDDLVVKGSLSTDLFIQRIEFDASFWATVFPKLELFFHRHMLPELAFQRIKYGLPRLQV